jgi:HlyD family secretion protein
MAISIRLQSQSEELISEEVREIISYRPHWMIRRGNVVFFSVLLLLVSLTVFIRYPDVVSGSARLVAFDAPKIVLAKKEGKLFTIAFADGQHVKQGAHLAYFESTSDYKQVLQMQQWLNRVLQQADDGHLERQSMFALPVYSNLGELQNAYQALSHEWIEHRQFFGSGYYQQKRVALQQDLQFTARLKANILEQERLSRQEQVLQAKEVAAYDSLARDRVVAPLELQAYQSKLIGKAQSLVQTDAQLINNDISAHNKHKELLELKKQVLDQEQKLYSALLLLKIETEKWVQQYVVTAPQAGTAFFFTPLAANEQVSAGQELFYIQPAASSYYAQGMVGQSGLGKVKEGQVVKLNVESYPSEEYGYLKGTITAIAGFPNRRDSFLIRIDLPQGLTSNYKKQLFFRNNLSVQAEIITDNRRLFDRFFEPLRKLWQ